MKLNETKCLIELPYTENGRISSKIDILPFVVDTKVPYNLTITCC